MIIPVYNTYEYLVKCIESVLAQTLKSIEIIVVNDGSTDESLKILNQYVKTNGIILIDKKNEGQGVARNKALDIAQGQYIAFIDSDDYIENDMLERMYEKAESSKLDITICNYKVVDINGNEIINNISLDNFEIINSNECIKRFLVCNTIEGFSWNKLFSSKLFNENCVRYPANMKYEDIPVVTNLILNSNKIGFVNEKFYYYVQRGQSTTNQININNLNDFYISIKMVGDILKKSVGLDHFKDEYQYYYIKKMMYQYINLYKLKDSKDILDIEKFMEKIRIEIIICSKNFIKNKYFSKKDLIKIVLFKIKLVKLLKGF